jgi:hypothetical protein
MAVKRKRKATRAKAAADAYEQTMLAEGAPAALDLLGLGSRIRDLIRGRPRKKSAAERRLKKLARRKPRAKARVTRRPKKPAPRKKVAARRARRRR